MAAELAKPLPFENSSFDVVVGYFLPGSSRNHAESALSPRKPAGRLIFTVGLAGRRGAGDDAATPALPMPPV